MSVENDPRKSILMRDFGGLILDQDPRDIAAGAGRSQVNLACFAGQLNVRKGFREVSFESTLDAT